MTSKLKVDDGLFKEVGQAYEFRDQVEKAETVSINDDAQEDLNDMYDDDILLVEKTYEKGEGYIITNVQLYEDAVEEAING